MCKVLNVASQKGGVTKTTTVLNLTTALGMMGKKVLAVDLDPQGSLTVCAGVKNPELNRGHDIGAERALQTVIEPLQELYDVIIIDTPPSLGIWRVKAERFAQDPLIRANALKNAAAFKAVVRKLRSDGGESHG